MDHIDSVLTDAIVSGTTRKKHKLLPSVKAAIAVGKQTLNRYYDKTDHSEVYRIAMGMFLLILRVDLLIYFAVLHPRHKLEYFKNAGWLQQWIDTARNIVDTEFKRGYASRDVEEVEMSHQEVR